MGKLNLQTVAHQQDGGLVQRHAQGPKWKGRSMQGEHRLPMQP